jgi:hypothetical protein
MWDYLEEFAELVVPDAGIGVPWSMSEVDEVQDRATQRQSMARDLPWFSWEHSRLSSFQKREPYQKITEPRNITPFGTKHRAGLSSFTYPFTDSILKKTNWYAFGLDPQQVALRIRDLASTVDKISNGDYSRWDGRVGVMHQAVQSRLFLRWCAPYYRRELKELLDEEWNETFSAQSTTQFGIHYCVGTSRASGSPMTSCANTFLNAFEKYCAWRHSGLGPVASYDSLGIYGGDDSLDSGSLPESDMLWVVEQTGSVITWDTCSEGEPVPFLGRIYVNPWVTNASTIDVRRQLKRLTQTTAPVHVDLGTVLHRKATAFAVTDSTTPFLRSWTRAVFRLVKDSSKTGWCDLSYHFQQNPTPDAWVFDPLDWGDACVANGLDPCDVAIWENLLDSAKTVDDLFFCISDVIDNPSFKVEFQGQLIGDVDELHGEVLEGLGFSDPEFLPPWLFAEPVEIRAPLSREPTQRQRRNLCGGVVDEKQTAVVRKPVIKPRSRKGGIRLHARALEPGLVHRAASRSATKGPGQNDCPKKKTNRNRPRKEGRCA